MQFRGVRSSSQSRADWTCLWRGCAVDDGGVSARSLLVLGLAAVMVAACGASPIAMPSPSPPSTPSGSPTMSPSPSPSPTPAPPPKVRAGTFAYVAVSVATGWRSPTSPRLVDAPATANPVQIEAWVASMTRAVQDGLIGRVDTQLLLWDSVKVLAVQGQWVQVVVPDQKTALDSRGYPVWIPLRQLTAIPPPKTSRSVMVVKPTAVLRATSGSKTLRVSFGTVLPVLGVAPKAYEVAVPGGVMVVDTAVVSLRALPLDAVSIIANARYFLGLKYIWGGTSGFGYDCSGLVYSIFKAHGILLPRDSDPQSRVGVAVRRANLQPGDLVFFSSGGVAYHVAIYAGQGLIIDSPSPGYPVEQLPLATFPAINDYSGARRVLPATTSLIANPAGRPASIAVGATGVGGRIAIALSILRLEQGIRSPL
jgi:gamma-D-glutamyl-L-lysine dipeptidyl-peptidase